MSAALLCAVVTLFVVVTLIQYMHGMHDIMSTALLCAVVTLFVVVTLIQYMHVMYDIMSAAVVTLNPLV